MVGVACTPAAVVVGNMLEVVVVARRTVAVAEAAVDTDCSPARPGGRRDTVVCYPVRGWQ